MLLFLKISFFYNLFSFLNFSNLHKSFLLFSIFLSLSFLFSNLFFHKASFFYCSFFNQFHYFSLILPHSPSVGDNPVLFLFIDPNIIFFLLLSFHISFPFFLMSKTIHFFYPVLVSHYFSSSHIFSSTQSKTSIYLSIFPS